MTSRGARQSVRNPEQPDISLTPKEEPWTFCNFTCAALAGAVSSNMGSDPSSLAKRVVDIAEATFSEYQKRINPQQEG